MSTTTRLERRLDARIADGLYRERLTIDHARPGLATVDGIELVNFCSNDYLGLAASPELADALARAAREHAAGAGASHLVCGHTAPHRAVEERLAALVGAERAILFPSGYMANLGAVTALAGRATRLVCDRLNHASLVDAALLSRAAVRRYRHLDCDDAARCFQDAPVEAILVTDSVFSMDGDVAPLENLGRLAARHDAPMLVDDAHGFGVVGDGRGVLRHADTGCETIMVGTLGKAAGLYGAFVAGRERVVDALVQFARPYVYTTALPPVLAAALLTALDRLEHDHWRRQRLGENIARFRAAGERRGLPLGASTTPIQPLVLGHPAAAVTASAALRRSGHLVTAIRPPTVPEGTSRLRIALSAAHAPAQVDALVEALAEALDTAPRAAQDAE